MVTLIAFRHECQRTRTRQTRVKRAILTGHVGTWLQRESAERAVADAPGISQVDNRIVVEPGALDEGADEIC